MDKIWIVEGSSGEYDAYRTWMVKAFSSEEKALELAEKLNNFLKEKNLHIDSEISWNEWLKVTKDRLACPDDPGMSFIEYGGANYYVLPVLFEE